MGLHLLSSNGFVYGMWLESIQLLILKYAIMGAPGLSHLKPVPS